MRCFAAYGCFTLISKLAKEVCYVHCTKMMYTESYLKVELLQHVTILADVCMHHYPPLCFLHPFIVNVLFVYHWSCYLHCISITLVSAASASADRRMSSLH